MFIPHQLGIALLNAYLDHILFLVFEICVNIVKRSPRCDCMVIAPTFDSLTMVSSTCVDPRQGVESEQRQSQRFLPKGRGGLTSLTRNLRGY